MSNRKSIGPAVLILRLQIPICMKNKIELPWALLVNLLGPKPCHATMLCPKNSPFVIAKSEARLEYRKIQSRGKED